MLFDAVFNRQKTRTVTRSLGTRFLRFNRDRNEAYKNSAKIIQNSQSDQRREGGGRIIVPPWIRHCAKRLLWTIGVEASVAQSRFPRVAGWSADRAVANDCSIVGNSESDGGPWHMTCDCGCCRGCWDDCTATGEIRLCTACRSRDKMATVRHNRWLCRSDCSIISEYHTNLPHRAGQMASHRGY